MSPKKRHAARPPLLEFGDLVLARLTGYKPWPGLLVNPATAPAHVLQAAPSRRAHIVRFFPNHDYGFISKHALWPLDRPAVLAQLSAPHKKASKGLRAGYDAALRYLEGEYHPDDELAAPPATSRPASSQALRSPGHTPESPDPDTRRAQASSSSSSNNNNNNKLKRKAAAPASAAAANSTSKSRKIQSSALSNPSEEPVSAAAAAAAAASSSSELDDAFHMVKSWRYDLQRLFFGPGASDVDASVMEQVDGIMRQMELYKDITAEQLAYSKVIKVLKKILVQLSSGPAYEPHELNYHFRPRIEYLLRAWLPIAGMNNLHHPEADASKTLE